MITRLKICNFKSHSESDIKLSNLTVLTGINGCGKTSMLQSLLLLRQSYIKGRLKEGLDLNDPLCSVGLGDDALYKLASSAKISFEIADDKGGDFLFEFNAEKGLKDSFIIKERYNGIDESLSGLSSLSLFNNDFQYISALRWGGRSTFPKETYAVESQKQISLKDGQGELVAHFMDKYGKENVSDYYENEKGDLSLLSQVVYWEQRISPNVTINVEAGKDASNYSILYGFKGEDADIKPIYNLRAENIGFGISYTLPVVLALISAKPGAVIIIENPEAHLHPGGQAALAELITKVANNGVQVIVETHSDHIITGIQLACKKSENLPGSGIDKEKVKLYYFYKKERHASVIEEVKISGAGILEFQPKGFFDQAEKDMFNLYNE